MSKRTFRLSLEGRRSLSGYLFMLPFLVGFMFLFLIPFVRSVIFSLSKLTVTTTGYTLDFVGIDNYRRALLVDPDFPRIMTETIADIFIKVPAIVVLSFTLAVILNQEFRGRLAARLIFFLPVIITSGVLTMVEDQDFLNVYAGEQLAEAQNTALVSAAAQFMSRLMLPTELLTYVGKIVDRIPDIINSSGIPILIFLAALQSIPKSLYEAADIEGATGWDNFWRITFPLVSPMILTVVVYVIVDSFASPTNKVMKLIVNDAWGELGYGLASAMAWIYFAVVGVILAVTFLISSRRVFYHE